MFRGRTLLFLVEVKGHLRSPEVEYHPSVVIRSQKQNFPRIPKIDILIGVTIDKKAKFPKCSQDLHLGSPEVKKQNTPRTPKIGKESLSLLAFWLFFSDLTATLKSYTE